MHTAVAWAATMAWVQPLAQKLPYEADAAKKKKKKQLTKEVKDLYLENYKKLMKQTDDDTNRKIYLAHGLSELIMLK